MHIEEEINNRSQKADNVNISREGSDDDMPHFAFDCKKASNLPEDREEAASGLSCGI